MSLPVVFLHAFPLDASMWASQRAALADRTVLTPNFPGFGGRPPGEPDFDAFAQAVVDDMDEAGVERAIFVALSMGGYVAFRLWARWPERVAALLLADTRAGADGDEAREKRTEQAERARREGVGWLAESVVPGILGETTRSERPQVVEWVRQSVAGADREGVARALHAMRDRPDSGAELPGIRVPVMAVVGEEDALTPPEEARAIAESVPEGELRVLPGAGHLSNLEDPAAFNAALTDFLEHPALGT